MITGSNTNVRYRGMLFHVQTEDSGRAHPHVISHLYCGGTIIASQKHVYADDLETVANLEEHVRALMEAQHKAMLTRLKNGDLDGVIGERLGAVTAPASDGDDTGSGASGSSPPAIADTAPSIDEPRPQQPPPELRADSQPAFGGGPDSQKPLDEVILEYLVEKARERAPERGEKTRLRSKG